MIPSSWRNGRAKCCFKVLSLKIGWRYYEVIKASKNVHFLSIEGIIILIS